jgi:hypothetical protein
MAPEQQGSDHCRESHMHGVFKITSSLLFITLGLFGLCSRDTANADARGKGAQATVQAGSRPYAFYFNGMSSWLSGLDAELKNPKQVKQIDGQFSFAISGPPSTFWIVHSGHLWKWDGKSEGELKQISKVLLGNSGKNVRHAISLDNHNRLWICTDVGTWLYPVNGTGFTDVGPQKTTGGFAAVVVAHSPQSGSQQQQNPTEDTYLFYAGPITDKKFNAGAPRAYEGVTIGKYNPTTHKLEQLKHVTSEDLGYKDLWASSIHASPDRLVIGWTDKSTTNPEFQTFVADYKLEDVLKGNYKNPTKSGNLRDQLQGVCKTGNRYYMGFYGIKGGDKIRWADLEQNDTIVTIVYKGSVAVPYEERVYSILPVPE